MSCVLTCLCMFLRGSSTSWAGEEERNQLLRLQETLWSIIKQVTFDKIKHSAKICTLNTSSVFLLLIQFTGNIAGCWLFLESDTLSKRGASVCKWLSHCGVD
jgi:hypothetical protein